MSRVVKARKVAYEFYETPETYTRYLFRDMAERGHPMSGTLFEPCSGSGAIVRASAENPAPMRWLQNDLDTRWLADTHIDATSPSCWSTIWSDFTTIDWTVTNPPFEPAIEILDHAIHNSRVGVAMHLRMSIHEPLKTGIRRTFFREHRPTGILYLPRFAYQRSPTKGTWTSDSMSACWVIWIKDATHQFIDYAPESVLEALDAETPIYRARMDTLMGYHGTEIERQAQRIALFTAPSPDPYQPSSRSVWETT